MSAQTKGHGSHLGRTSVIASHTFTQLVRMKVFYFMGAFAVILIVINFLDLPQHSGPEAVGANVLRLIKNSSLGAMTLFSVVLGVVATALLLPKDVEDRTLYTILAKPVPRIDYLAGKLLGVLGLIFVSLLVMDLLMSGLLHVRTQMVVDQQMAMATALGYSDEARESLRTETLAQGPTWSLQGAVLAVFLRSAVIAALALLVSTFSTSTLFTAVISFLVFFIGHFQADMRAAFLAGGEGEGWISRGISLLVSLVLPDFQLFSMIDAVIEGQVVPVLTMLKLVGVGVFYVVFYTVCSWLIFADKEF
jgi:ABC-type Na+ efflux pump permease subunit